MIDVHCHYYPERTPARPPAHPLKTVNLVLHLIVRGLIPMQLQRLDNAQIMHRRAAELFSGKLVAR